MLNLSPDIICHGELFNPDQVFYANKSKLTNMSLKQRDSDTVEFLNNVYSSEDSRAIGFKHFFQYDQKVKNYFIKA